jgi:hypothetical protein
MYIMESQISPSSSERSYPMNSKNAWEITIPITPWKGKLLFGLVILLFMALFIRDVFFPPGIKVNEITVTGSHLIFNGSINRRE